LVTFRLIEENDRFIIYWYFPDGNEDKGHGVIKIDKSVGSIYIEELAADDFSHDVSIEEQNETRRLLNAIRTENGEPELTEKEWPLATKSFTSTFFADHAISKIAEAYEKGIVLNDGMSAWY